MRFCINRSVDREGPERYEETCIYRAKPSSTPLFTSCLAGVSLLKKSLSEWSVVQNEA